jgi:hypothetical protein
MITREQRLNEIVSESQKSVIPSSRTADLRRAALLSRNKGNQEGLDRVLAVLKAINVREIP